MNKSTIILVVEDCDNPQALADSLREQLECEGHTVSRAGVIGDHFLAFHTGKVNSIFLQGAVCFARGDVITSVFARDGFEFSEAIVAPMLYHYLAHQAAGGAPTAIACLNACRQLRSNLEAYNNN